MTQYMLRISAVALLATSQPLLAQQGDKPSTQPPLDVQYYRPQDQRGINMFETPKVAGAPYTGFKLAWGAAFTQQFQGLTHRNTADSVFSPAVNPFPGSAGSAAVANRNRLMPISNTLYSGDRAGSRYYFVMENYVATEAAQFTSGRINPGFSDKISAYMINPFVKVRGLEFFGMYEKAKGRAAPNTNPLREVNRVMYEGVYRFLENEKLFVGARWNQVDGNLGGQNTDVKVTRGNVGGGWFITPSLLLKAELMEQTYTGFTRTDIRNGGKFRGFMIEAVTAF